MKDEIRKLIVEWFHSQVGIKLIADPSLNSLVDEIEALRIHDVVGQSEQFYCDGQENNKDRCETQCLGCTGMQEIYGQ